jgi:hypothetical protein
MIGYGNPNRTYLQYLSQTTYLDSLLPELNSYPYADNNSQEAIDEINVLINATNELSSNAELEKRYFLYDEKFEDYIINVLSNKGIPYEDVSNIVKDLHNDIVPIITKLKYNYQRIRPLQLSFMYQMGLYPYQCKNCDSPSYPSGHSLQSRIYCEVLGNKYPKYYKQLMELANDISKSRIYLGVHYPSDCTFANYVSDVILNHPEFKRKYKL